jgi:thiol-disulfide isomerase/thioredoxin
MKPWLLLLLVLLPCRLSLAAEPPVELLDLQGKPHTPLVVSNRAAVVLFFLSPFCPTSNAFTPEVNQIAAEFEGRFQFYVVEADANITVEDAKKHAETLGIKAPVLLDPQQRLVRRTNARITPEAVILAANGEVLYQGRINDLYTTQTRKLKEPASHELLAALEAISANRPVTVRSTKAVGCTITLAP